MTVYLDSSVVLRWVLGQLPALPALTAEDVGVTSALTEVECLRTLDRMRRQGLLPEAHYPTRRGLALQLIERMDRVLIGPAILRRAAEPFPTPLGTHDAIHLSTALRYREGLAPDLVLATHDGELATAGRAVGMATLGT